MTTENKISKNDIEEVLLSLWQPLNNEEKKLILENFSTEQYEKNEYIYKELEIPARLKFVATALWGATRF